MDVKIILASSRLFRMAKSHRFHLALSTISMMMTSGLFFQRQVRPFLPFVPLRLAVSVCGQSFSIPIGPFSWSSTNSTFIQVSFFIFILQENANICPATPFWGLVLIFNGSRHVFYTFLNIFNITQSFNFPAQSQDSIPSSTIRK